jgi:hypothetical protein
MIGMTSGDLQVIALGDDGAPTGAANHLATRPRAPVTRR